METYVAVLTGCAVLLLLALLLLVYRAWKTLSEVEELLRDARQHGLPALEKIDRTLEATLEVVERVKTRARTTDEELGRLSENLLRITDSFRSVSQTWSEKLSASSNRLSLAVQVLLEIMLAYKRFRKREESPQEEENQ